MIFFSKAHKFVRSLFYLHVICELLYYLHCLVKIIKVFGICDENNPKKWYQSQVKLVWFLCYFWVLTRCRSTQLGLKFLSLMGRILQYEKCDACHIGEGWSVALKGRHLKPSKITYAQFTKKEEITKVDILWS